MRRVVLGLVVIPAVVGVGYFKALASPVDGRPAARLARLLEGDFRATTGHTDAIVRKACRVDAPGLGDRALYVEERFEHGAGRPFSQRLVVVSDVGATGARVREYTFADPGAITGACARGARARVGAADVLERAGCDVSLTLRDGSFVGRVEGRRCESVLNGASHAKRAMEVSEREVAVHDRGYTDDNHVAWGAPDAIRYARR